MESSSSSGINSAFLSSIQAGSNAKPIKWLTWIAEFFTLLERSGFRGPEHFRAYNLYRFGRYIGGGSQFEVFEDKEERMSGMVFKRVRRELSRSDTIIAPGMHLRANLRLLELEILTLARSEIRQHPNIVNLIKWGYDYHTDDSFTPIPVLVMEKALSTLSQLLCTSQSGESLRISNEDKYYLCLDITDGLSCLHGCQIVHGDLKPENILIFKQDHPQIRLVAKLSDFGLCLALENSNGLRFHSYRGTDKWKPPEVQHYTEEIYGAFSPELLLKSDSYSCGLLMVSTMLIDSRFPFESSPFSLHDGAINESKNLIDSHPKLDAGLGNGLKRFCKSVLCRRPIDRKNASPVLLESQNQAYRNWVVMSKARYEAPNPQSSSFSEKAYRYWARLDPDVLRQLDVEYCDAVAVGWAPRFTTDTMLGMAISFYTHGDHHSMLNYLEKASAAGSIPAQAIFPRIYEAVQGSSLNEDLMTNYLYAASATGSLLAGAHLKKINSAKELEAIREFKRNGGYSSVHYSCSDTQSIFENEDPARIVDLEGNNQLHVASQTDRFDLVLSIVNTGKVPINVQNNNGETPLYKACLAGAYAAVKVLLGASADAAIAVGPHKITCLHWLFVFKEDQVMQIAKMLMRNGGQLDARTVRDQENYRDYALWNHFPFHWPLGTPLHWACAAQSIPAAEALVACGLQIDVPESIDDDWAQSCLALAMYHADSEMVAYLISRGASACRRDRKGRTSLYMLSANENCHNKVMRVGKSLLRWTSHGHIDKHVDETRRCVNLIAEAGGLIDAKSTSYDFTPLFEAIYNGDGTAVIALVMAGADVNQIEWSGRLPVKSWVRKGKSGMAYPKLWERTLRLLLERTRDWEHYQSAKSGEKILHFGLTSSDCTQFEDLVHMLQEVAGRKLDMNMRDFYGRTPLLQTLRHKSNNPVDFEIKPLVAAQLRLGADVTVRDQTGSVFIWYVCSNDSLSDSSCSQLIDLRLNHLDAMEQCRLVNQAKGGRPKTTALMEAVKYSYESCVDHFLKIGVELNILDSRNNTALDIALERGETFRLSFLVDWYGHDFRYLERPISDPALFNRSYGKFDKGTRPGRFKHERYHASYRIVAKLSAAAAKRGRDLVNNAGPIPGPSEHDRAMLETAPFDCRTYTREKQPFYDGWKILYDLE